MASISLYSRTSSSLTVRLTGLDSSYSGTKRIAKWYVGGTYKKQQTLSNGITQAPTVSLTGLSASTKYTVKCIISNIQGMSTNVTLTNTFWTEDPTPTISSFTVTQTATGTKKAKCSWKCSNLISGATYKITVDGWEKASGTASTSGSKTISLDYFKTYTATLTVYNNDKSASKSKTFTLYDYDLTPTNINITKINGGFKFTWSGASDATYHRVKLVKGYNTSDTQIKTVSSRSATFTNLEYGVRYIVYVQSYNSYDTGSYEFGYDCTTAPAQPTATASANSSGVITVSWSLRDTSSSISTVWINLYDSSNTTCLQTKTAYNKTSGTVSFSAVGDGTYYLRLRSMFEYNGTQIVCVDSSGNEYTYTRTVTVSKKPQPYYWTYTKTSGGDFNLTAAEWNGFTNKINEFREWKGLSSYSFTQAVKGNNFTATMYNQARTAIKAIDDGDWGNNIPSVSKGQIVTAYMLNILISELNVIT